MFFKSTEESVCKFGQIQFLYAVAMDKVTGPEVFVFQLNVISKRDLPVAHILIFFQEDTQVNIA